MQQYYAWAACLILGLYGAVACRTETQVAEPFTFPATVDVVEEYGLAFEVIDPEFLKIVDVAGAIEVLAGGFTWSEGPVWVQEAGQLLFSDVPNNVVYRYDPRGEHVKAAGIWGVDTFLYPSGYLVDPAIEGEPGANGLLLDQDGALLLAQHGERQVARLKTPLSAALATGRLQLDTANLDVIASRYTGRRLNSPNDIAQGKDGSIYFTDPTYGVDKTFGDSARELDFAGVYRVAPGSTSPVLLYRGLVRPNGVVLNPSGDSLIVSNSETERLIWMRCPLRTEGDTAKLNCLPFADLTSRVGEANPGNADGMVMLDSGVLLATGPGGVLVFSPGGRLLGVIRTGRPTANVTVGGPDGRDIFITANDLLLQARLK